jgi:hypothetical protein
MRVGMLDCEGMLARAPGWSPRLRGLGLTLVMGVGGTLACAHDWETIYDQSRAAAGGGGGTAGVGASGTSGSGGVAGGAGTAGAGAVGTGGSAGGLGGGSSGTSGSGGVAASAGTAGLGPGGAGGSAGVVDPYPCADNLLGNGGMEDRRGNVLDDWVEFEQLNGDGGDFGPSTAVKAQGNISLALDTRSATSSGGVYIFGVGNETLVSVSPGETLSFFLAVRVNVIPSGEIPPQARIVYYDDGDPPNPVLDGQTFDLPAEGVFVRGGPFSEVVPDTAAYARIVFSVRRGLLAYVDAVCLTK